MFNGNLVFVGLKYHLENTLALTSQLFFYIFTIFLFKKVNAVIRLSKLREEKELFYFENKKKQFALKHNTFNV